MKAVIEQGSKTLSSISIHLPVKVFTRQIYLAFLYHFFTFLKENATTHNRLIFTKIIERGKI